MRTRLPYRLLLALLVLTTGWTGTGRAAVSDRIAGSASAGSRVAIPHLVSAKVSQAVDVGAAPESEKLEMAMRFSMTDAQKAALTQLLSDQLDANSPRYHQWLTPQQFGTQFGLSASDLAKVTSWLSAQGFAVTNVAKSSTFVTFSGTVGQVAQAFGTSMHRVSLDGEMHIANLTDPVLPAAIAGVVGTITGLDDFKLKARARKITMNALDTSSTRPRDTVNTSKGLLHYIAPGDFYTIYNVNPLLSAGVNGTGISIAVMGQVDLNATDVAAFRTASGLPASTVSTVTYGTDPGSPTASCLGTNPPSTCSPSAGDLEESQLDVEWAGAVAPSANIIFVNSTDVLSTSLVLAIDNNIAPIMTVSYGACESSIGTTNLTAFDTLFSQANAQGITIVGPSGDSGATDCDDTGVQKATHGLSVDFPASSPHVTAVGGTQFTEGADTATPNGTYWNNTTTSPSSALSYIPEAVWNETAADLITSPTQATLSAGGGGASAFFAKPSWQTGTGVPADGVRDVPDVSLNASAAHDPYLVCAESSCVNGTYFTSTGSFNAFGGTSISTPSFAGILALVEQKLGGGRLGNANPYIYSLANSANYSTIFHDVTSGDNKSPCTIGTTNCTVSPIGYSAGNGYDLATGWGSVDSNQFATRFTAVVTTPLPVATTLTLAPSASNPAVGASVTFLATVAHAGTTTPTGSVTFSADGGGGSVVTLNGGTASYTTSFPGCGKHTIYATFTPGDANYYGSSVTTPLTVGLSTCAITLAANAASVTIASGGTATSTITVTSVGGFAGAVNLTALSSTLNGSAGFSVNPVTVTAGGTATTVFTATSVTAAAKATGQLKSSGGTSSLAVTGGATLAGLLFFGVGFGRARRSRKGLAALLSLIAIGALSAGLGCSSSSSSGGGTTTTPVTKGTYIVQIVGTDATTGSVTGTTNLSITLQ